MIILTVIFYCIIFVSKGEEEEEAERCAEQYIRQQELQKIQTLEGGETEVTTHDNENETGDGSKDTL